MKTLDRFQQATIYLLIGSWLCFEDNNAEGLKNTVKRQRFACWTRATQARH
jgi:hypothetical protein